MLSAVPGVGRARPCPAPDPNAERDSCAARIFRIILCTAIGQLVKNPYIRLSTGKVQPEGKFALIYITPN